MINILTPQFDSMFLGFFNVLFQSISVAKHHTQISLTSQTFPLIMRLYIYLPVINESQTELPVCPCSYNVTLSKLHKSPLYLN